jgi:hypothetical protein
MSQFQCHYTEPYVRFPPRTAPRHSITLKRKSTKLLSAVLSYERIYKKIRMFSTHFSIFLYSTDRKTKNLSDLWIDLLMSFSLSRESRNGLDREEIDELV